MYINVLIDLLVELPPISAASMITRKDIKEFKESVRRDNDAIIKIGSGETVTVSKLVSLYNQNSTFWLILNDLGSSSDS
jgi:hypothetical protein